METELNEPIGEEMLTDDAVDVETESVPTPTQDITARLAEDFLMLEKEFPQFISPNQLPDGVLDMAAEQGITLLDAYLRYRLQEEKKVAAAVEKQREAAMQSAGSLSRGAVQTPPEQDAFLRAFRSAL